MYAPLKVKVQPTDNNPSQPQARGIYRARGATVRRIPERLLRWSFITRPAKELRGLPATVHVGVLILGLESFAFGQVMLSDQVARQSTGELFWLSW